MKFQYKARTKTGEIRAGTIEAPNRTVAVTLLQRYGLFVTSLKEVEVQPIWAREIKLFKGVSTKEIAVFSRQLSILFSSGVSLVESLQTLASQTENPAFREKILRISEDVEGGTPLSQALSRYPRLFSPFYQSMVRSGEVSGTLSDALNHLSDHLEREYHLSSKMKGAMVYPILVLVTFFVILTVMAVWVFPQLVLVFKTSGLELPLLSKIFIAVAGFLAKSWLIIVLLTLILAIFVWRYFKSAEGKRLVDEVSIKLPIFAGFLKMIYLSRFAENLSTLIAGGLPISKALEITGEIVGNEVYKEIILETRTEVRKGAAISQVLSRFPREIPPMFVQMTLVGEQSGKLDAALMNIVRFYRKEIDTTIDALLELIEPVLILFLGIFVAGFFASILLPLYGMIGGG